MGHSKSLGTRNYTTSAGSDRNPIYWEQYVNSPNEKKIAILLASGLKILGAEFLEKETLVEAWEKIMPNLPSYNHKNQQRNFQALIERFPAKEKKKKQS